MSSSRMLGRSLTKLLRLKGQERLLRFHSAVCGVRGWRKPKVSHRNFSDETLVTTTYPEVTIPDIPFHSFIFENLGQWEDKTALECVATGKRLTYRDVHRQSQSLAGCLQKKFNLKKGERMATVLPNYPDYPVIFLAGSMAGVVSTTINPVYTPHEMSFLLKDTEPKLIFTTSELYQKCVDACSLIKVTIPIVVLKTQPDAAIPAGAVSYSELVENPARDFNPVSIDPNDDLVVPFSSGTSGLPKGVQLTHRNIVANIIQYNSGNRLKLNPNKETNQNIILGVLPMFHIYGMVIVAFDGLWSGAQVITLPRFEPKSFIQALFTKKTELLYVAPPLVFFMGSHPMVERKHFEHAQYIISGAAPCGKSDVDKLLEKAPNLQFCQGYGMTETSPVLTMSHYDRFHKVGSIGHPLASTQIKVADIQNGKPLQRGSRGEICVKGPQVMKGYLNRPEETKNTFDNDGWLKTGDVGYFDEEGDFFIVDRMKELIKVKGFQVAPAELEEILRHHPKVADAAVIGVDHPEMGQAPKAFIVLKQGMAAKQEEIEDYVKDRLSSYKQLKGGVRFVKEIPKSSAGKILRKELRKLEDS